jgi:hypothetical protein
MAIHAFSCTRSENLSDTAKNLNSFFSDCGIKHKFLVGETSIFDAYSKAVSSPDIDTNDIVILCHDDIIIHSTRPDFLREIIKASKKGIGFLGVAGTSTLPPDGIWWKSPNYNLSGEVYHLPKSGARFLTRYGPCGQVEVLDGLFLVSKKSVLLKVGLDKPDFLSGGWDFYDIHYTYKANKIGYNNYTVPIKITHLSLGELTGRPQWHENRTSFLSARSSY